MFDAIKAYNYIYRAQQLGVNVVAVNNSWGYAGLSEIFIEVVNKVGEKGAVSVFAAGNDSLNTDNGTVDWLGELMRNPSNVDSPYVINVAAVNEKGELAQFSNYGENSVDIAAPGTNILSTVSMPTFNPTIYDNKIAMTDYFTDFSSVETFPVEGGTYYKDLCKDSAIMTESIDSSENFGIKDVGGNSLKW